MGRVLVIDGDPVMRGTIRKILMREGHKVREACNSGEGLDLFRRDAVDVVVTDLAMPAQEGVAAIFELFDGTPGARVLGVSAGPRRARRQSFPGSCPTTACCANRLRLTNCDMPWQCS